MRLLLCALLCLLAGRMTAQNEQDFASRFMELYAEGTTLDCTTVSPLMMERMMQLPDVEADGQVRQVLSQLKSIRMVTNRHEAETQALYQKALSLAQHNPGRYKLQAEEHGKMLYVRYRGKRIVEVVLLIKPDAHLCIVNLTGNMTDSFMNLILNI